MSVERIAGGDVIGRFTYTSRGSLGWGVSSKAGQLVPDVIQEGAAQVERLSAGGAQWGEAPALDQRQRRVVWGGAKEGVWRYLVSTYAAGRDAAQRPDNNFSDIVVVRRTEQGPIGERPTSVVDSSGWLSPYGAGEVAVASVEALDDWLLPKVDTGEPPPLDALIEHSLENSTGEYFFALAHVVLALGAAQRAPRALAFPSLGLARLYLDAALSLAPADVLWDVTFELRPTRPTQRPTCALTLFESEEDPDSPDTVWVSTTISEPVVAARNCAICGRREESWEELLAGELVRNGHLAQRGEAEAHEAGEFLRRRWQQAQERRSAIHPYIMGARFDHTNCRADAPIAQCAASEPTPGSLGAGARVHSQPLPDRRGTATRNDPRRVSTQPRISASSPGAPPSAVWRQRGESPQWLQAEITEASQLWCQGRASTSEHLRELHEVHARMGSCTPHREALSWFRERRPSLLPTAQAVAADRALAIYCLAFAGLVDVPRPSPTDITEALEPFEPVRARSWVRTALSEPVFSELVSAWNSGTESVPGQVGRLLNKALDSATRDEADHLAEVLERYPENPELVDLAHRARRRQRETGA